MLSVLSTILYIVVFLLCLSVLIVVHELGHLTAAKVFKVYCYEFSIGMGPAIFKHKKKGGETQFSLRAVPFGGYVAMYGEETEENRENEETIDPSRSINGINKWKKCIILLAGVTMNAVLAFVVFFVKNAAFTQRTLIVNAVNVVEGSKAELAGITNQLVFDCYDEWDKETHSSAMLTTNGKLTLNDDSIVDTRVVLIPDSTFDNPKFGYILYGVDGASYTTTVSYTEKDFKSLTFYLTTKEDTPKTYEISLNVVDGVIEDSGLRCFVYSYRYTFGQSVKQSLKDFGNSATAIIDSFGMLFSGEAKVDQLTGVVGIGFVAKEYLDKYGVSTFIYLWGLISVNLAIVNLVPFPGLDGWQILVTVAEGITRKKFPEKVKNIVSVIGIGLLLIAMVALLAKDIWVYILQGLF